ncbi:hypothetical protein R1sor_018254 [Riccia sorocarpa]|uniref:Uncharacterized protein n=1 Tax=Riccia sorocarpa TaxID=122646 RepID=A0ABD3I9B1_9MARC
MTEEEKREYNHDACMKGLPYLDVVEVHARRLKEAEQLYIDPDTCARPIERDPRANVHPDGPQKVSRDNT